MTDRITRHTFTPEDGGPVYVIEVDKWPDDGVWVGTVDDPRIQVVNRVNLANAVFETLFMLEAELTLLTGRVVTLVPTEIPE